MFGIVTAAPFKVTVHKHEASAGWQFAVAVGFADPAGRVMEVRLPFKRGEQFTVCALGGVVPWMITVSGALAFV
jgi:hypothetical protein